MSFPCLLALPITAHRDMLTALTRTAASRSLARSLHTTPARTMPLYVCYCPDYPDNLQTRLKAREAHLAAATEDKKTGASGESGARVRACCSPLLHQLVPGGPRAPRQHCRRHELASGRQAPAT